MSRKTLVSLAQRLRAKKAGLANPKPPVLPKPKKPKKKNPRKKLPLPEKGKKPERITTPGDPGGPHTPGAKLKKKK